MKKKKGFPALKTPPATSFPAIMKENASSTFAIKKKKTTEQVIKQREVEILLSAAMFVYKIVSRARARNLSMDWPIRQKSPLHIIEKLTNRFHVAVRLFSNRSQMTSKCGKNKKVAHEAQPSVSLMFLPHFDVLCDLLESVRFEDEDENDNQVLFLLIVRILKSVTVMAWQCCCNQRPRPRI